MVSNGRGVKKCQYPIGETMMMLIGNLWMYKLIEKLHRTFLCGWVGGYAPFDRAICHTGTEKGMPMFLSTIILSRMHI